MDRLNNPNFFQAYCFFTFNFYVYLLVPFAQGHIWYAFNLLSHLHLIRQLTWRSFSIIILWQCSTETPWKPRGATDLRPWSFQGIEPLVKRNKYHSLELNVQSNSFIDSQEYVDTVIKDLEKRPRLSLEVLISSRILLCALACSSISQKKLH